MLANFFDKVIHAPFNPFLPIFVAETLGRPQSFAAAFRAAETLAQTLASFGFGLLSTNARAKTALVLAALNTPLAAAVFLMRSPSLLMVAAAVHGALSGVASSVSSLYLVTLAPPERLGAASSLQYVGATLGSAIGSAIGGMILARGAGGKAGGFGALAGVMLASSVPVLLVIMLAMPSLGAGTERDNEASSTRTSSSSSVPPSSQRSLGDLLRVPAVDYLLLMQGLRTCWWGSTSMSIPYLLNALTNGNKSMVGLYSLGSLTSAMLVMLLGGALSDAHRPHGGGYIVRGALCLLAVLSPMIGIAGAAGSAAGVFVAGWVATCLAWTVSGQVNPLVGAVAEHLRDSEGGGGEEGRLTGLVSAAWAAGSLCGGQLHGRFVEGTRSLWVLYVALGGVLLLAERATARLVHTLQQDREAKQ